MKKQMNVYINDLCGTDMDILQDIVTTKYKQFKAFYRAVEDVSEYIDHVSYGITNDDVLSVKLYLADGVETEEIAETIKEKVNKRKYKIRLKIKENEKVITISVTKESKDKK